MSSKTKYWSSFVAVNWISLNTSLSTIRSVCSTPFFSLSQYGKFCENSNENESTYASEKPMKCKRNSNTLHQQNYCFQVRMTRVRHAMVSVFGPFSGHIGTAERAVVLKYVCTGSTKTELGHAINHDNAASIHSNSSPTMLCAKIPILDKHLEETIWNLWNFCFISKF